MDRFHFEIPTLKSLVGEADWESLLKHARIASYRDAQVIHQEGDATSSLCIVQSGQVKLVRRRADGQVVSLGDVGPGQHYGDIVAILKRPRTHEATACGPTVVAHVEQDELERLVVDVPAILLALYKIASIRLLLTLDVVDDFRALKPTARLAKLLLMSRDADHSGRIECTREGLADLVGISSVTLASALSALNRLGLVSTGYGHVTIEDRAKLHDWVLKADNAPDQRFRRSRNEP